MQQTISYGSTCSLFVVPAAYVPSVGEILVGVDSALKGDLHCPLCITGQLSVPLTLTSS